MLSRTAEAFYWIGRYVERAEYTARMAAVYHHHLLGDPDPGQQARVWERLLTGSDLALYRERHGEVSDRGALSFLVLDTGNPNAVVSALSSARENARAIQDQVSSEVWRHLNRAYLDAKDLDPARYWENPEAVLRDFQDLGYAVHGVFVNTMSHDDRLAFFHLGRELERAVWTVRMLRSEPRLESPAEPTDLPALSACVALLKSACAHEAYRKTYRAAPTPLSIVSFLALSDTFPRSVRFCARAVREALTGIAPEAKGPNPAPGRLAGQLGADLDYTSAADIYETGLADYLDDLAERLNALNGLIARAYFRYEDGPGAPHAALPQRRRPFPSPAEPTTGVRAVLAIAQSFSYVYTAPVTDVRTVLRLVPNQRYGRQRLLDVRLHLDPPGEVSQHVDAFGNQVWQIEHPTVARAIAGSVEMLVENHASYHAEGALALRGVPPEEDGTAGTAEYALPTALTDASDAMIAFADRLAAENPHPARRAEAAMHAVAGHMAFATGVTDVQTTASLAFDLRRGVCQDYAHVMLSLCRLMGLSARYVSGYLPAEGYMHAWVEVLAADPATGVEMWVAYDPTHARRCDEAYVTVALGRDYRDVAPMGGYYTGTAANSLEVQVSSRVAARGPSAKSAGTTPLVLTTPGAQAQSAQQQ